MKGITCNFFNSFFGNLHPTEAPKINKQKFIENSGNLYVATSLTCKIPLATKVPDNKAAGIFNLSNNKTKTIDAIIRIIRLNDFDPYN